MRPDIQRAALVLAFATSLAHAQLIPVDPDWKEADAPAPPAALRTQGLVPLNVEASQLRWGVDPATVSIGPDGIVRYVVVASSDGGAVNAFYEGIRCGAGEVKVYARRGGEAGWVPARAEWQTVFNNRATRHSLAIARDGACTGKAPNVSAGQITRDLASNSQGRYSRETR